MIKQFFKPFLLFSLLVMLLVVLVNYFFFDAISDRGIYLNTGFFFLITLISGSIMTGLSSKEASVYQNYILINFFAKLLVSIAWFIIIYNNFSSQIVIFVLGFFLLYSIFTIFEVSFLVRIIKDKSDYSSKA